MDETILMPVLRQSVNYITSNGGYAIIGLHHFGRYILDDGRIGIRVDNKVIFNTNNEYNSKDQTLVLDLNQAAINAIRAAGAKSQCIFAEGNSWSGA
ncbi:unnamed protein product [Penicillium glandicola]